MRLNYIRKMFFKIQETSLWRCGLSQARTPKTHSEILPNFIFVASRSINLLNRAQKTTNKT
uniref:Uncharacterized protein n=1 Tax=Anguilla anguilla TaxID=7936 RepID=A0A0E9QWW4_ANGAN